MATGFVLFVTTCYIVNHKSENVLPSANAKMGFMIVFMVLYAHTTDKAAGQVDFFLTCKPQLTTVFLD